VTNPQRRIHSNTAAGVTEIPLLRRSSSKGVRRSRNHPACG
jgi:hypothetical protein